MSLKSELDKMAHRAGGSFKTREARENHCAKFAAFLKAENIRIERVENIKAKHLVSFAAHRLKQGGDGAKRTIQNEMGSLRQTLRESGRSKLADLPACNNRACGISGASRQGTKTAMTRERSDDLTGKLKDPGERAAAGLQRELGLRRDEAIQAGKSLKTWEKNLQAGTPIFVIFGTKGGRERHVQPSDQARALAAVRAALNVAETRKGKLIDKGNLKQARDSYSNSLRAAGFVAKEASHALRYAFAKERMATYLADGLTRPEALAALSKCLGHGEGRGRYCESVYLR